MTQLKWLKSIRVVEEPFQGWQQQVSYHMRYAEDEQGEPVTRILPRSLMIPPGIPDFFTRRRFVQSGECVLKGRAWSGWAPIAEVEVSADGGESWAAATLDEPISDFAWRGWTFAWQAKPGEYELCCRATDEAGNTQPTSGRWKF